MALKILHIWTYILLASVDTVVWAPGLSGMGSLSMTLSDGDLQCFLPVQDLGTQYGTIS